MLATMVRLRWCYGAAIALPLPFSLPFGLAPWPLRRRHVGVGPLERVLPAIDDLPGPDEDPRTGRRLAVLLHVKVGDLAPAPHRLGQPAQQDAIASGYRDAPAATPHAKYEGEFRGGLGHPQPKSNRPAPVPDLQRPNRIRLELLPLGRVHHQRLTVGRQGAVDFAE